MIRQTLSSGLSMVRSRQRSLIRFPAQIETSASWEITDMHVSILLPGREIYFLGLLIYNQAKKLNTLSSKSHPPLTKLIWSTWAKIIFLHILDLTGSSCGKCNYYIYTPCDRNRTYSPVILDVVLNPLSHRVMLSFHMIINTVQYKTNAYPWWWYLTGLWKR
jgi:hypothetical protein